MATWLGPCSKLVPVWCRATTAPSRWWPQAPFFFDPGTHPYLTSCDVPFGGEIWRRDGQSVAVRCLHKTLAAYFSALERSGWVGSPQVEELGVSDAMLQEDPAFFGPLAGLPLHLLFALTA